jgi:hypothetical protein
MNDWADNMAGRLKQRAEDQRLRDTKSVEQQRIKRSRGEPLWQDLLEQVAKSCEALNARLSRQVLAVEVGTASELRVRADAEGGHLFLHAKFNAEAGTLSWSCEGGQSGRREIVISEDGSAGFAESTGMPIPTPPSKVAKEMLDALLGF